MTSRPMDCEAARALFSEHRDRRLAGERRAALLGHLEGCGPCTSRWRLYAAIFDGVAQQREVPAFSAFRAPREAPGAFSRSRPSLLDRLGRGRIAVAAALLLAVTHFAVFEWGQAEPGRGGSTSTSIRPLGEVAGAGLFPARLRDHADGVDLLSRQVAYMPPAAGAAARELVRAQLDLLGSEELLPTRGPAEDAGTYETYARSWRALSSRLGTALDRGSDRDVVRRLQDEFEHADAMWDSLVVIRERVASEPEGRSWTTVDPSSALVRAVPEQSGFDDVRSFLRAQGLVLKARYTEAAEDFDGFRRAAWSSRLQPVAAYMQAECLRRVGRSDRALQILATDPGAVANIGCFRVVSQDPLGGSFLVLRAGTFPFNALPNPMPAVSPLRHFILPPMMFGFSSSGEEDDFRGASGTAIRIEINPGSVPDDHQDPARPRAPKPR